ncbi:MAG TPA: excinuclease ABC subunit UvrC [Alphaproteobacteria bacterium]|nr:excinuclease ABC subunit UvrC [Alphaproteobacteria bacterium]
MTENTSTDLLHRGKTGFDTGADVLRAHLKTMPQQPGIYRMMSAKGEVMYVGKAKNLKKRVSSYTQRARLPHRLQRMVAQIRNVEIVLTHTEAEALLLEANFIQRFMPPFNVLLRDDKSYPYILLTRDHKYPQLLKHRGKKSRKGSYFGPFASAGAVNETLTLLQRAFMLRNCTDSFFANRTRPCLQYHIKRCTAPCVNRVSEEDYRKQVDEACAFLKGKTQDVQQKAAAQMQAASDALDFETAAKLRDRIRVLTAIQSRQDINVSGVDDADVIALHQQAGKTAIQVFFFRSDRNYGARTFYPTHDKETSVGEIMSAFIAQFYTEKQAPPALYLSDMPDDAEILEQALATQAGHKVTIAVPKLGDKKRLIEHARKNAKEALGRKLSESSEQQKLLNRVAEIFGLAEAPKRIEVYDNSHISGTNAVGGMIAAGPEGFLKKTYRKFNIKGESAAGDDYAMMNEVLTRRFRRLIDEDPTRQSGMWPDLVLIDGGQGQLTKAMEVMEELGLPDVCLVGIAKGPDRNAGRERFFMPGKEPFSLPMEDPALYYLQRLRDEAHRFAIGTHRAKRTKSISQSGLEDIGGIGATRKKALLHHFGSAKAVAAAGLEDLARVPGISLSVAKKIHDYFREQG